jgi:cyanophycinase-like exopeptidase
VDQHLLRRNRVWRLQQMLESHPDLCGLGVDERAAVVVEVRSWKMSVIGESYALVCVPASGAHPSRIEVLKPGDTALLSQLRTDHLAYHPPGGGWNTAIGAE